MTTFAPEQKLRRVGRWANILRLDGVMLWRRLINFWHLSAVNAPRFSLRSRQGETLVTIDPINGSYGEHGRAFISMLG
jgi:hypothetical protein